MFTGYKMMDDSCSFQYIEIVPLLSVTGESGNGDCSSEDVKDESIDCVKQEPYDVCWTLDITHTVCLLQMKLIE